ncbi:MAG: bacteriohemerythrin [Terracidiphilus sp.]
MALAVWSDKLSVGVKSIDDQHMVLFETLSELHAAMMKGQGRTVVGPLLHTLMDYTDDHFSAEEAIMVSTKYPGTAAHIVEHRELIKQVKEYAARFEKGDMTLTIDLSQFLSDWLTNHIQKTDREYSPWLKEHGVQ